MAADPLHADEINQYGDWLLQLGSGSLPVLLDRPAEVVQLPDNIVSRAASDGEFIDEIFPNLWTNANDRHWLRGRAIMTTLNKVVDRLNEQVMQKFPGPEYVCYSADSVAEQDDGVTFSPDVLNSTTPAGLPPHKLILKVGAMIMLLRNLGGNTGACNGTRLFVTRVTRSSVSAVFANGERGERNEELTIPRIPLTPSDTNMPYTMTRRQFPIRLAFVMTINKSQGQTLQKAGLILYDPVFSHGQLYVALSRVGSPRDISVRIVNNAISPDLAHHADQHGAFTKSPVFMSFNNSNSATSTSSAPARQVDVINDSSVDFIEDSAYQTSAVQLIGPNEAPTLECPELVEPDDLLNIDEPSYSDEQ